MNHLERLPTNISWLLIDELRETGEGQCGIVMLSALSERFQAALDAHPFNRQHQQLEPGMDGSDWASIRAVFRTCAILPFRLDLVSAKVRCDAAGDAAGPRAASTSAPAAVAAEEQEQEREAPTPRSTAHQTLEALTVLLARLLRRVTEAGLGWLVKHATSLEPEAHCVNLAQLLDAGVRFEVRERSAGMPWSTAWPLAARHLERDDGSGADCATDMGRCSDCAPAAAAAAAEARDLRHALVQAAYADALHDALYALKAQRLRRLARLGAGELLYPDCRGASGSGGQHFELRTTEELAHEYEKHARARCWNSPHVVWWTLPPTAPLAFAHGLHCKPGPEPTKKKIHTWRPLIKAWFGANKRDQAIFGYNLVLMLCQIRRMEDVAPGTCATFLDASSLSAEFEGLPLGRILELIASGSEQLYRILASGESLHDMQNALSSIDRNFSMITSFRHPYKVRGARIMLQTFASPPSHIVGISTYTHVERESIWVMACQALFALPYGSDSAHQACGRGSERSEQPLGPDASSAKQSRERTSGEILVSRGDREILPLQSVDIQTDLHVVSEIVKEMVQFLLLCRVLGQFRID